MDEKMYISGVIMIIMLVLVGIGVSSMTKQPRQLPITISHQRGPDGTVIMGHDIDRDGEVDFYATYVWNGKKLVEVHRENDK